MRNKLWGRVLAFTLIFSFLSVPLSLSAREGGSLTLSETVRQVLAVHPPMELRTLADWVIRPRLLAVPGWQE